MMRRSMSIFEDDDKQTCSCCSKLKCAYTEEERKEKQLDRTLPIHIFESDSEFDEQIMNTEGTYLSGYKIDYPPSVNEHFNNKTSLSTYAYQCCSRAASKKLATIKEEAPERSVSKQLSPSEIASRCQIAIEGKHDMVCMECRPVLTGSRKSV